MQMNQPEAVEGSIEFREVGPDQEDRPYVRPQGSSNRWWVYVIAALAFVIVAGALYSISEMKTVVSDKATLESENKALKEQLAVKTAAPAVVAPIVKVDETPKAKLIEPEKLRIVVAASYAYDDSIEQIKIDGLKAVIACQPQFSGLSFRVTNAKTVEGTKRVIIIERNVGMDEDGANLVAACIEGKIVGAQKPMVKNPKLYRKDSL